jgi:beta-xylosidase
MTTPTIAWEATKATLFDWPDVSLKDPALTWHDGYFILACSVFHEDNTCQLMSWRSKDLATWEGPLWTWGSGQDGWCSPDIIRHDGRFIMTYQSWDSIHPRESQNKIFYSTNQDAVTWSKPKQLAANLTVGKRAIDAALAFADERWYLLNKEAQQLRLATATQLDGDWELLPEPFDVWAENGQFIQIDGTWHISLRQLPTTRRV